MARKLGEQGRARGFLAAVASTFAGTLLGSYHPERHYMRGPGPKTLDKIGEGLRDRMASTTTEPIPEEWLKLVHLLEAEDGAGEAPGPHVARRAS
jgi:hypothetical protein